VDVPVGGAGVTWFLVPVARVARVIDVDVRGQEIGAGRSEFAVAVCEVLWGLVPRGRAMVVVGISSLSANNGVSCLADTDAVRHVDRCCGGPECTCKQAA
jgi:hypothetical protein